MSLPRGGHNNEQHSLAGVTRQTVQKTNCLVFRGSEGLDKAHLPCSGRKCPKPLSYAPLEGSGAPSRWPTSPSWAQLEGTSEKENNTEHSNSSNNDNNNNSYYYCWSRKGNATSIGLFRTLALCRDSNIIITLSSAFVPRHVFHYQ